MLQAIPLSTEDLEFRCPIEWEEGRQGFFLTRFLVTWKRVIAEPLCFFENLRRRASYWRPFTFAFFLEFLTVVAGSILWGGLFSGFAWGGSGHWGVLGADFRIFRVAAGLAGLAGGLFGAAFLYYIVASLLGASGPYRTLFRMYAYTESVVVLELVPWIGGLLAAILRFWLLYAGFRTVYRFSQTRAILAAVLPGLLLAAVMGWGGFSFYRFIVQG